MSMEGYNNFEQKLEPDFGTEEFLNKEPLTRRNFFERMKVLMFTDAAIGGVLVGDYYNNKDLKEAVEKFENTRQQRDIMEIQKIETAQVEDEKVSELVEEQPVAESVENVENRIVITREELFKLTLDLPYEEKVTPLVVENLNMPGEVTKWGVDLEVGKVLRTLRYQDFTRAAEKRYKLPKNLLLSMILEESTGEDLLPNGLGDGGFGLCHMQGVVAKEELGLKTFKDCHSMICNGVKGCKVNGKFVNHAEQLKQFMIANKNDRRKLVEADERLNILKNIDAAARKVAAGIAGKKLGGEFSHLNHLQVGIARYSGTGNYKDYWRDVSATMEKFNNSNYVDEAIEVFNKANPNLKANGKNVDYYGYLEEFRKEHVNYGLDKYIEMPKYLPINSEEALEGYDS
jgi:hypothetical protein